MTPSAAVREGLARTGRVITAAAAVMVAVFGAFAISGDRVLAMFGLAMASAVFLDALVVRMLLLPAVLQLLGRTTWALPRWLDRRLPRIAIEADADAGAAPRRGPRSSRRSRRGHDASSSAVTASTCWRLRAWSRGAASARNCVTPASRAFFATG